MMEKIMDNLMEIILTVVMALVDIGLIVGVVLMFIANPAQIYEYIFTGVMFLGFFTAEAFMLLCVWGW